MPIPQLPGIINDPNANINDLVQGIRDYQIRLERELQFMMQSGLDSTNAFEFGGWRIKPDVLVSKNGDVGMSSLETAADDIRFFAGPSGATYLFYVTKGGLMVAQNADIKGKITALSGFIANWVIVGNKIRDAADTVGLDSTVTAGDDIRMYAGSTGVPTTALFRVTKSGLVYCGGLTAEGGIIRTGAVGTARIELSGGKFSGYNGSNQKTGLYFDINAVPGTGLADIHLYHNDAQLLTFFDNTTNFTIKPGASASSMILGATGKSVQGDGTWTFSLPVHADITGNAATATTAGSSTTSGSSGSASTVPWSGVTGTPTTRGGYGISDAQATITGAATTITASNLTASRALSSDTSGKVAVSATTSAQLGYLSTTTSDVQVQIDTKASKTQEAWNTITLSNSWVNFGGTDAVAAYKKDQFGFVHIKGLIKSGTVTDGTVLFALPVGYRPLERRLFVTLSASGATRLITELYVDTNGNVFIYNAGNSYLTINIPSFLGEQ